MKIVHRRRWNVTHCGGKGGTPGPCPTHVDGGKLARVTAKLSAVADKIPVVGTIKKKMGAAMKGIHSKLESRYGPKVATAIMTSGAIGGYGVAAGAYALTGTPGIPFVNDLVSIAAHTAVAEAGLQLGRLGKKLGLRNDYSSQWYTNETQAEIIEKVNAELRAALLAMVEEHGEEIATGLRRNPDLIQTAREAITDYDAESAPANSKTLVHNKLTFNARRPLKEDPTRTGFMRRRFEAMLKQAFDEVRRDVYKLVYEEDAFGIDLSISPMLSPLRTIGNVRYAFLSAADQIRAFTEWLRTQVAARLLSREELWKEFIQRGFEKGALRSFEDVKSRLNAADPKFYQGTREEFLRSSFARPVAAAKVELIASRVYTELAGVTEEMAKTMTLTLADGLVTGDNPRVIARQLAADVGISLSRSRVIARTEIIRAHAEGQLQAMSDMGVREVGVQVEWRTAGDTRVCPKCRPMEGVVLRVEDAQGKIPLHPNCRCAWIPYIPPELLA